MRNRCNEKMPKAPIPYFGGKCNYVDDILPLVPVHKCYLEPFAGAASILLAKDRAEIEIYNDLDHNISTFYKVLRDDFDELRRLVELTPYSREEMHICWASLKNPNLSDMARARAFFAVSRMAFSGKFTSKPGLSSSKMKDNASSWLYGIDCLYEVHQRIRGVTIENLDAIKVIKKYDGKETFIYLDPPYLPETRPKSTKAYLQEMGRTKHAEMLGTIVDCKSMILLSGYHNELYDEVLYGWHFKDWTVTSTASHTARGEERKRLETLWWNDALDNKRVGKQLSFV